MNDVEQNGTANRTIADIPACPVCGRAYDAHTPTPAPCERCGADLGAYRDAMAKAQSLLRIAESLLRRDPLTALRLAERSTRLHATLEAHRVRAVAALCARRHSEALAITRFVRGSFLV